VVILYTAELYPTGLRATAVGFSATMGRLGAIAAPILAGVRPVSLPLSIMGASALLGGLLVLLLPETLAQPFPESVADIGALYRHSKPWYQWMTREELKTRQERLRRLN
jgi:OCT family organic cation transporter-like MFS transporter 4/5